MDENIIPERPETCVRYRRQAASLYLKVHWGLDYKPSTLGKYVSVGGGPAYQSVGRIPYYPQIELDKWAASLFSPLKKSSSDGEQKQSKNKPKPTLG
jgi:hypothetical protein